MAEPRPERPVLGILFMLAFSTMASTADAVTKSFTEIYPVPQLLWLRFSGQTLALLLFMPWIGVRGLLTTRAPSLQLLRGFLLFASAGCFVLALSFLPFSIAKVLGFSSPLLVAVLSWPLLGERVSLERAIAILLGFFGVLIVIRPGGNAMHWAMALPLLTSLTYALYQISTRRIAHIDGALPSLFYVSLVGFLSVSVLVPFHWIPLTQSWHLPFLLAHGAAVGLGHFLQIKALTYAKASLIAPFGYASLLWAVVYGWLLFGEAIDAVTLLGALIIAGCGIFIFRHAAR